MTNLLWHGRWRPHTWRLIVNDPANGLQGPLNVRGVLVVIILLVLFTLDSWVLYGLWLLRTH